MRLTRLRPALLRLASAPSSASTSFSALSSALSSASSSASARRAVSTTRSLRGINKGVVDIDRADLVALIANTAGTEIPGLPTLGPATEGRLVIVDVRSDEEIHQTGDLTAGVVHVPLNDVLSGALASDPADFEDEYGSPQPCRDDDIVVMTCAAGVRSAVAATIAESVVGYRYVCNYKGGANEWFR